jgi:hypothetical protein
MSLRARLQPLMRWLPLAIILLAGAGLRLDRIGELPPGLYRDEAWYGLDAGRSGHLLVLWPTAEGSSFIRRRCFRPKRCAVALVCGTQA